MAGCRPLSDEEIELVQKSFTGRFAKRNRALFYFSIKTGFRISETLSVLVGDVVEHGRFKTHVFVAPKHMKGKKKGRTVVLHDAAKAAIGEYLEEYRLMWDRSMTPDMYLFRSQRGVNRPLSRSQVAKIFHDIYDTHQFTGKLGTHVFRKIYARRMWELLGKDIVKVQAAMDHANINSTVRYLQNFTNEDIEEAILKS